MSTPTYDILLVEDNDPIREVLRLGLETEGFRVREARDGREALAILEAESPPSIILLDLLMPGMSGMEFLDSLRAEQNKPMAHVPVVVMSAIARTTRIENPQVRCILPKPVKLDELFQVLHQYIPNFCL